MWQKVRSIWRYVHAYYADVFDFFIIGGHDLYVLPQNLRDHLATYSRNSSATVRSHDNGRHRRADYPPLFLGRRQTSKKARGAVPNRQSIPPAANQNVR
jgi:glycoprotein-N-acetylgalactosamine 3-beta-galactosyltransferase